MSHGRVTAGDPELELELPLLLELELPLLLELTLLLELELPLLLELELPLLLELELPLLLELTLLLVEPALPELLADWVELLMGLPACPEVVSELLLLPPEPAVDLPPELAHATATMQSTSASEK
jgi:titin